MSEAETARTSPPERPTLDGLEAKWGRRWESAGTYAFDRAADRGDVYAIDTPPPTVSGSLHVGHVYSFTHTDAVARYQRMRGKAVFYPMGWDDNGLPTERRVQNVHGVRCDPALPYDPAFAPPATTAEPPVAVSRRNFIELCEALTATDERVFEELWRRLGLSVDWGLTYTTIGPVARAASQRAFLRNLARGEAYAADAPTLWDVGLGTAVAQAEVEDRERDGAYHRLRFTTGDSTVEVDTTRPELLAACVALVCHPDDGRYAGLVGGVARTPVFGARVPIHAHPLAEPAKGTGIAMVCTYGDLTDVVWWRDLRLATRVVIGRDGRLLGTAPDGLGDPTPYAALAGRGVSAARREMVGLLRAADALVGEPRPVRHAVKFYEKGDAPLEIVASRQWYLRNGGRDEDLRQALLRRGRELRWVPESMRTRYEHWVNGLTGDWLVSRQRFFGVPVPLWYRLDDTGEPDYGQPLTPDGATLPVDPSSEAPPGYDEAARDRPGGFTADPDVLDTWATSSLTPQLVSGWARDPDLFARVFPMDLRPQGPEIIRTWLFGSVVRAHLEHDVLPWRDAVISGWVLDPDRKKMSKSKGNVTTPMGVLDRFGADAARYWACCGRPGTDLAFEEQQLKVGRRLATKLLNASRFVLGLGAGSAVTAPLDLGMLAELRTLVDAATTAFDGYDHTGALQATERFFWSFCDDHIELVKDRAYGTASGADSARGALRLALGVLLRLFAPFLPYATEEVWSWHSSWSGARPGHRSVHRAAWPDPAELPPGGDPELPRLAGEALRQIRRAKSERQLSLRTEIPSAGVRGPADALRRLDAVAGDLRAAGRIGTLTLTPTDAPGLTVTCALP